MTSNGKKSSGKSTGNIIKTKKKNVLVLLTASYGGGAERLVLNHAKFYDKDKYNLHIITLRPGNIENIFKEGVTNYLCLKSGSRLDFRVLLKLREYILKNKIDIVHTHLIEADMYGFLLKLFLPWLKLVSTKHCPMPFRKKLFWRVVNKLFSVPANHVITVSGDLFKFIRKYEWIPKNKMTVIHNGVDPDRFKEESKEDKRKELGYSTDIFILGVVGRVTEQKGIERVIYAAHNIKNRIPNLCIVVVGDGDKDYKEELLELAHSLGVNIYFTGNVNNVEDYYSIFDIFCMSSRWEGFGIVTIEAMASGNIVFADELRVNLEVVGRDAGFVFPMDSTEYFGELISFVQRNPIMVDEYRKRAREIVKKWFNAKKNIQEMEDLYSIL